MTPSSEILARGLGRAEEITVDNRQQQPLRIVIDDHLPLSNDDDVEVKAENLGGRKFNIAKGSIEWNLIVKPLLLGS